MYHHIYFHSIFILILFNFYCYSSPIQYIDQNEQEQTLSSDHSDKQDIIKPSVIYPNNSLNYLNLLCALYNDCYDKDQQERIYSLMKSKRLTSNLFHGFPKFGKRALKSAFSGISKFG